MEKYNDSIELMHRQNSGIEVFLLWHRETDILSIVLKDELENVDTEFVVPNDKGLQAFEHPYVFRPS